MAEQARRVRPDEDQDAADRPRARVGDVEVSADGIEKVLRFSIPSKSDEEPSPRPTPLTARDFATAVDIVHDAAEAMRAAESRSREADARTQLLAQRATEELKNAEARTQAAEARARAAEARAQEAEARAKEAESWLRQIFSTITEELPSRRGAQA